MTDLPDIEACALDDAEAAATHGDDEAPDAGAEACAGRIL